MIRKFSDLVRSDDWSRLKLRTDGSANVGVLKMEHPE
jgi:hypothetical protein